MKRMTYRATMMWLCQGMLLSAAVAQELKVSGRFLADSLMIGSEVTYTLTARYPAGLNVLFPDSTLNFSPFEYAGKQYFPTKTTGQESYDSVLYYLRTFETDTVQVLALPVYAVHPADCTAVYAQTDSILLKSAISSLPDTISLNNLPLKESLAYQPVPRRFNYIMALLIAGFVAVSALTFWLLFGRRIRRHFLVKRLIRNHARFVERYGGYLATLKTGISSPGAESTVAVWKNYMENLERIPFTKLTTRETIRIIKDEALIENLHSIDRAIYGNQNVTIKPFEGLQWFAEQKFKKKLEEVKHG